MPPLRAKERAQLPDSAFAYIDSSGKRRLPINDASHVRNALSRFNQVAFEDEAARDRARSRLLRAAQEARDHADRLHQRPAGAAAQAARRARSRSCWPTSRARPSCWRGSATGTPGCSPTSAALVRAAVRARRRPRGVGARRRRLRGLRARAGALEAALAIQRAMREGAWPDGSPSGCGSACTAAVPSLTETGYVGLSVHAAARICFAAHGGQIVLSVAVREGTSSRRRRTSSREPRRLAVPRPARAGGACSRPRRRTCRPASRLRSAIPVQPAA